MKEFKDKVAVVTGAASGIGFAMADRFAAVGMKVVLADIEGRALAEAERQLSGKGAPVIAVTTDVSDQQQVDALAERACSELGGVHVLCNNAGVATGGLTWEHDLDDWHWVLGVNLYGVIHGIRSFVPRMLDQGSEGHIVNTASIAGLISSPYIGIYEASKHAVVALTESLAMELATREARIGASVLCPGFVATRISDSARNRPGANLDGAAADDGGVQSVIREMARRQVEGGMSPSEVADEVVEAIRSDRFWILTHSRYEKLIRRRFDGILSGENPRFDPPS